MYDKIHYNKKKKKIKKKKNTTDIKNSKKKKKKKNGQSFLKGGKALNTPSENATGAQGPKSDLLPIGQVSRLPSLSTSSFHTLTFIPIYYLQVSRR